MKKKLICFCAVLVLLVGGLYFAVVAYNQDGRAPSFKSFVFFKIFKAELERCCFAVTGHRLSVRENIEIVRGGLNKRTIVVIDNGDVIWSTDTEKLDGWLSAMRAGKRAAREVSTQLQKSSWVKI